MCVSVLMSVCIYAHACASTGSHGTELYYLRSANRAAALPDERNWYIGFRCAADDRARRERESDTTVVKDAHSRVQSVTPQHAMPTSWPTWSTHPVSPVVLLRLSHFSNPYISCFRCGI